MPVVVAAAAVIAVGALVAPAAPPPTAVAITVVKGRPVGGIKRTTVKKGTVVRYVVRTDRGEGLHLHGYDIEKPIRAGKPTVVTFTAKLPGRFELELHGPDAVLARLTVR
jgi:hypothetical protein